MILLMILLFAIIIPILKFSFVITVKGMVLLLKLCLSLIGVVLLLTGGVIGAVFGVLILIGCGIHMLATA